MNPLNASLILTAVTQIALILIISNFIKLTNERFRQVGVLIARVIDTIPDDELEKVNVVKVKPECKE